MKYYIRLVAVIDYIGGGHIYMYNKQIAAEQAGYKPILIYAEQVKGQVPIEYFNRFLQNRCKYMHFEPALFSSRQIEMVLSLLQSFVPSADPQSIIETDAVGNCCLWAELLAKKIGCMHFHFPLDEQPVIRSREYYLYLRFKYERHELVGISKEILPTMFKPWCSDVKEIEGRFLPAYCTNSLIDIPCPHKYDLPSADYTIGSVGRLDKKMVLPASKSIIFFMQKHLDKTFNLLYVGGANIECEQEILRLYEKINNAKVFITGKMFPIPAALIKKMDVAFASAGSCSVCEDCGIPTISIDGRDFKAIGIFRRTTNNSLFRNVNEPAIEVSKLLEQTLIEKKYVKEDKLKLPVFDFSSHWQVLRKASKQREYYDVSSILNTTGRIWLWKMKLRVFGYDMTILLSKVSVKIKNILEH